MTTDGRGEDRRVAIVTGGGAGLGAATARALAAAGDAVLVNNRRHPDRVWGAQAVVDAIESAGGTAIADAHAVDAPDAAAAIVAAALARFGRIDALVLNAGVTGPAIKVGNGDTGMSAVMAINFFAGAALVEAALPHLLAGPAGRIVFISSAAGLHGVGGRAAYAASKGALIAYALSLAAERARTPLRVNVVAPYAATKMTVADGAAADPRLSPDLVAPAIAWFAGADCTRTGEVWVAGGGHVRRAAAMEGAGGAFAPDRLDTYAALASPRSFPGAERAFADFHTSLPQEDRCPD